jgi:copper resistance protein B
MRALDEERHTAVRYEIRREFAPYVGLHWEHRFGETAELAREQGDDPVDLTFVAGLRAWF